AVEISKGIRLAVQTQRKQVTIQPVVISSCLYCESENIKKDGIRHNRNYDIQRYECKDCNKKFSINIGFEKMHASPHAITSAMQLYFSGESLRSVQRFLSLQGIEINHTTIYRWIKKYVGLMQEYADNLKPQVSDIWRSDELFVKVRGNMKYMYAVMDDDTRYWIAQQVSYNKYTEDVRPMFRNAEDIAGKKPKLLITDGAPNFHEAWKAEYKAKHVGDKKTEHLRQISMRGMKNNNKMERLNGEVRDREKVVRGVKSVFSPIFSGSQIYHNFIKPHMGLEGKTPAEACGIKVEGENKWITLIQNAKLCQPPTSNRRNSPQ
ncbi:MAG: DDE-type integrase/transposase/recombinase, partial [Thaumarchaeota archaeon]|nr:DDE-type integrase/transposase/recombinase [Nitrososphaerota archaeon]